MVVNADFNAGCVHNHGLAEGAGFAHEHRATLAERTIEGLDEIGLAFAFRTGAGQQARPAYQRETSR
jgi:hypothetical protein